jgi:hypothetical protein
VKTQHNKTKHSDKKRVERLKSEEYMMIKGKKFRDEPQFRSIIPCEVLLYIEVTFLGFIH